MNKFYIQLTLLVTLFINCKAQNNNFHFVKKFGLSNPINDLGLKLISNSDSTYFGVGLQCSICNGYPNDRKYILYKFNAIGNIISQATLFDTSAYRFILTSFFLQNNQLKLCGTEQWGDINATFSRGKTISCDFNFNLLHTDIVGDTSGLINNAFHFYPISNSETIYCGLYNDSTINLRSVLSKLDTSNTVNWLNYYTDFYSGGYTRNYFERILKDTDSNFIAIGNFRKGLGFTETEYAKSWLKKFDINGNEIWDHKIIDSSYANCGLIGNDGKIIIGGIKNLGWGTPIQQGGVGPLGNAPYVAKYNPTSNNVEWQYNFTFGNVMGDWGNSMTDVVDAHGNGYIMLNGVYDVPISNGKIVSMLVKLDENGNELWRKKFFAEDDSALIDTEMVNFSEPLLMHSIVKTPEGGYLLIGGSASYAQYSDVILIKTNCNGDTASPKAAINVVVDAATPNLMQVYNLSQYYDTCTFIFNDGSQNINLTMYDTVQNFTHAFAPGTTVTCIAKACNQEWDTIHYNQIITNNTLLKNNEKGMLGSVYPNPANNKASVNYYLPANEQKANIYILNSEGKQLQTHAINNQTGTAKFDVNNLPQGIYLLQLLTENGNISCRKFMKE